MSDDDDKVLPDEALIDAIEAVDPEEEEVTEVEEEEADNLL